jgi:hypothetical protein
MKTLNKAGVTYYGFDPETQVLVLQTLKKENLAIGEVFIDNEYRHWTGGVKYWRVAKLDDKSIFSIPATYQQVFRQALEAEDYEICAELQRGKRWQIRLNT